MCTTHKKTQIEDINFICLHNYSTVINVCEQLFAPIIIEPIIAHLRFQHSSSIRRCLKIGGTDLTFVGVNRLPRVGRVPDLKNSKKRNIE